MAINILIKSKMFEKYGITMVALKEENRVRFSAFLQPLRYKNKIYLSGVPTELGYDGLNKYLLIAPPELDIEYIENEEWTLHFDGASFATDHCETVYLGKKKLYHWAVVHKEG